ncbi:MAG: SDR family NAD(P)-dependent oxidoreductase [Pseudomonadota bacterium]
MSAPRPLEGQVAVITGASRRTGRELAFGLAEDGATVVVTAVSSRGEIEGVSAEIRAKGGRSEAILLDVSDETAVKAAFDGVAERLGRIDILVNNAGIRRQQPFLEMDLADWRSIMAVNIDGVFLCCRYALPHMIASGGGTIVNIGGVTAHVGAKKRAHVSTTKAAVVGLTRTLAIEFADRNVTVNCVAPGKIGGERAASAGESPITPDRVPLGREGTTTEAASAVRYLCQPEARFITGQTLHVSGGLFMP